MLASVFKSVLNDWFKAANDNSSIWLAVNNTAGNIATVTNTPSGGSATTVANYAAGYLPFGPPKGVTLGNGIATSYTYDKDLNLLTILSDNSTQNLTYTYDNAGNLTNIADSLNSANNQTLTYDVIDRLTGATSGSGGYGTLAYAYDKNGNRTSHTIAGTTTNYTTATSKNRLTAVGSQSITTDNNGSITALSVAMPSGLNAMAYAADGRLATASSSGGTLQTNTYDATGARVKKVASSTTTRFVKGLGGELLQEADGTNTLNYLYANGVPIAQFNTGGTLTYIHTDQRGAPVKATNTSKASQWSTSYDPFGQTVGLSNPGSLTMNLRLPGQYYDAETGLYDNGFRSYNPATGRYMQSDPIGLRGGMNTYGYVTGNPFKWVDPRGLFNEGNQRAADSFNQSYQASRRGYISSGEYRFHQSVNTAYQNLPTQSQMANFAEDAANYSEKLSDALMGASLENPLLLEPALKASGLTMCLKMASNALRPKPEKVAKEVMIDIIIAGMSPPAPWDVTLKEILKSPQPFLDTIILLPQYYYNQ